MTPTPITTVVVGTGAPSDDDYELTGSAIAGIVLGSVFAAILILGTIIVIAIWYVHKLD